VSVRAMQVALVRPGVRSSVYPALPVGRGRGQQRGGTRWRRFALVLGAGLIAAVVMAILLAQGALAASFTVSGVPAKISADQLRVRGVVQYSSSVRTKDGAVPVLVAGLRTVEGDNFCQSVLSDVPFVGTVTARFAAPGRNGLTADDVVLTTERLTADVGLTGAELGRDASTLDAGPADAVGPAGSFGLQGRTFTLTDSRQISRSVTAATLNLDQADLSIAEGRHECFD
jgi:hypothetical protein